MNERVISLVKSGIVFLIIILGTIFTLQAMQTEVDETTGLPLGDVSAVSSSVNFSMWLIWIILGLVVIFTIISIISNPKRFIPTAIGLVVFGIVVGIGFGMSDVSVTTGLVDNPDATENALLWGSTGIQTTFVLVFLALLLIIIQSVRGVVGYFVK